MLTSAIGGLSQTLTTAHRVQSKVDYLHTVCVPPRDKRKHEHKHELCLTPVTHIACENRAAIGNGAPVESHSVAPVEGHTIDT